MALRNRRFTGMLVAALTVFLLVGGGLAGSAAGLQMAGSHTYATSIAKIEVEVQPSRRGGIDVYVPLVDWGVEMRPFSAPVEVRARIRTIDRRAAGVAVSSSRGARDTLETLADESTQLVRLSLRRAALIAIAGGAVGGLFAGALLASLRLRRRFLLAGAVTGVAVSSLLSAWVLVDVRHPDVEKLNEPTFYAHGRELPRLLSFSSQLLDVGDDYAAHYARALASLDTLLNTGTRPAATTGASFFVASDIHTNALVLGTFDRYAADAPVLLAGDYGQLGVRVEQRLAPRIAALGGRVVAVSGNHDSRPFMESLHEAGATVLRSDGVLGGSAASPFTRIAGLSVAGYDDPLEAGSDAVRDHVLRVYGPRYRQQIEDFIAWFDALPARPDIVLVHQHGFGHRLLEELERRGDRRRLVVVAGHDHKPHVDHVGAHVLIDGGTLGAGGPFAIGQQSASFAQVHLDQRQLAYVDIIEIEPVSGDARARRVTIEDPPA